MIIITAIVAALTTLVGTTMIAPTYEASTTLRVSPTGSTYTDFTYAAQLKSTLMSIATSDLVLDELAQRLGLDEPPEVAVESLGNSQLILLTVGYSDPVVAQQAANIVAEILTDLHGELYVKAETTALEILNEQLTQAEQELATARIEYERVSAEFPDDLGLIQGAASEVDLKQQAYSNLWERSNEAKTREILQANAFSVLEAADLPEEPSSLPNELIIALGAGLGLVAGIGLTFLFENLDNKLYTTSQIEAVTRLVTLGSIPTARIKFPSLPFGRRSLQEYKEAFRRLRTNLFARSKFTQLQTLLITSAEPREGKSTIAANLAQAIAESGKRVVAVDCDLHRPTLHTIFNLSNEIGLSDVLHKQIPLEGALNPTETPGLYQISAGTQTPKSAEILGTQAMTDVIDELRQQFDIIVLDTPAMMAVADTAVLAPLADGVLLVVRRAKVRDSVVLAACQQLANIDVRPIGLVVNRSKQGGNAYGYYNDYKNVDISSAGDPLTQIDGIGANDEKVLQANGISTFYQLGEQDAERLALIIGTNVNEKRIEGWIEQAKTLAQRETQH